MPLRAPLSPSTLRPAVLSKESSVGFMLEDMPTSCQTCVGRTEINRGPPGKDRKKIYPRASLYSMGGPLPKANVVIKTDTAKKNKNKNRHSSDAALRKRGYRTTECRRGLIRAAGKPAREDIWGGNWQRGFGLGIRYQAGMITFLGCGSVTVGRCARGGSLKYSGSMRHNVRY